MHWRVFAIFTTLLLALTKYIDCTPVAKQYIQSLPGFIPVYIRPGDTPLEDINPGLAAAFESYAAKHNRIIYGRSMKDLLEEKDVDDKDISLVQIDDDLSLENEEGVTTSKSIVFESQHIQKIPRH